MEQGTKGKENETKQANKKERGVKENTENRPNWTEGAGKRFITSELLPVAAQAKRPRGVLRQENRRTGASSVSFWSSLSFGARSLLCRSRQRKPSVSGESFPTRQLSQPLWLEVQPRPQRRPPSDGWRGRYSRHAAQTHARRHATGVTITRTPRMGGCVAVATGD